MAKFVAYYNLSTIHDPKEFLGLSKDQEEGNIITTLGRNIIVVIKLSSQKQVHSWTVLDKLSSRVVFDHKSEQYVGLFSNRYIRCWDKNILDVNKVKKLKFNKNIADLVCTEKDGVVLLYSDGSCESLQSGIESRKTCASGQNEAQLPNFSDSNIFTYPDGRKLLIYFVKHNKKNYTELVTQTLDNESLKPQGEPIKYNLNKQNINGNLTGYTVIEGQQFPSLLTIWSNKRMFLMPLHEDTTPEEAPGNFFSMLTILNSESPMSIVGISPHCVAIYGANSNMDGASLILYNIQFKVVKAKQFFKIYFNVSRLWIVDNHILLAMGQNLSVVSYRMSQELLSEVIGSQVFADMQDYIDGYFINEEEELEENWNFVPQANKNSYKTAAIESKQNFKNENISADGNHGPLASYDGFEEELNSICGKTIHLDLQLTDCRDVQLNCMANFNDSGFSSDEIDILAKELEKRGAGEQEISEKLLTLLLETNLREDITACLRRYTNISEKVIAKVLNYALNNFTLDSVESAARSGDINESTNEAMEVEMEVQNYEFPHIDLCLNKSSRSDELVNQVLSCAVNLDTIRGHVRKTLEFTNAIKLLQHLYNLINQTEVKLEERPENSIEVDDDVRILQWLSIVLDAFFQDIVLSKNLDVLELLNKWIEVLNSYKTELKELQELSALLCNVVDKKLIVKDKIYSKWYTIEEVVLY